MSNQRGFPSLVNRLLHDLVGAKLTSTELLVLLVIAEHASPDGGGSFPSMATIAEMSHMGVSTARRCVRNLEARGWLRTVPGAGRSSDRGGRRSNRYTIVIPEHQNPAEAPQVKPPDLTALEGVKPPDLTALEGVKPPDLTALEEPKRSNTTPKAVKYDTQSARSGRRTSPEQPQNLRKRKGPASKKPTHPALEWFCQEYERIIGIRYCPEFDKDGGIIKGLAATHDPERLRQIITAYLESDDEYWGPGMPVRGLRQQAQGFAAQLFGRNGSSRRTSSAGSTPTEQPYHVDDVLEFGGTTDDAPPHRLWDHYMDDCEGSLGSERWPRFRDWLAKRMAAEGGGDGSGGDVPSASGTGTGRAGTAGRASDLGIESESEA